MEAAIRICWQELRDIENAIEFIFNNTGLEHADAPPVPQNLADLYRPPPGLHLPVARRLGRAVVEILYGSNFGRGITPLDLEPRLGFRTVAQAASRRRSYAGAMAQRSHRAIPQGVAARAKHQLCGP